jgi:two-component system, chemotaxis family, protein-glutamate methylesterase/glutaminase
MERAMVVIGGSAGAVEALRRIMADLPPDLPGAVFVTVHFPPHVPSTLPVILGRCGPLDARHPEDGEAIRAGVIYVAPPNLHLLVDGDHVRLSAGPRENGHRPAVDPLFRSAARAHGGSVIAVLLSGNLDDGTAGMLAVRQLGGITVVQDPADARYSGMPSSALRSGVVDHVAPHAEIGSLIARLTRELPERAMSEVPRHIDVENGMAEFDPAAFEADERPGVPSGYTCPECHGALFEIEEHETVRYRCRVGHAYGAETLMAEQTDGVEAALWTAFKALKERAALARRLARKMESSGNQRSRASFIAQAGEADHMAESIAEVLRNGAHADWRGARDSSTTAAD